MKLDKLFLILLLTDFCYCNSNIINPLNRNSQYNYHLPSPSPHIKNKTDLFAAFPKNGIVLEIGVEGGGTICHFLEGCQASMIYLVDAWEMNPEDRTSSAYRHNENYEKVLADWGNHPKVQIIKSYSAPAAARFPDEYFDLIYIDANHSYEGAKDDIERWWPKVKRGGILAGDDYRVDDNFAVNEAVNEFLAVQNLDLIYLTTESYFEMWAIQKP